MILYPAIDIAEGKAVRLVQGDFADKTVYEDDPFEAAKAWVEAGARFLHVVDLDGARTGAPANLHHVERIARELPLPVQVGGGLRSLPAVRDALRAGAARDEPAFSEALHARVMAEVRGGGGGATRADLRAPLRTWPRFAVAAAVVAAVVGGVMTWRAQTSDVPGVQPRASVAPPPLPDAFVTRGAGAAHERIDAFVESQQFASLDEDAVRFAGFVAEQLNVVPLSAKPQ